MRVLGQNGDGRVLLEQITPLTNEWHRLYLEAGEDGAETRRIALIEEELDSLWFRRRVILAKAHDARIPEELLVDPFTHDRLDLVHVAPLC